jgi:hypothetical protein
MGSCLRGGKGELCLVGGPGGGQVGGPMGDSVRDLVGRLVGSLVGGLVAYCVQYVFLVRSSFCHSCDRQHPTYVPVLRIWGTVHPLIPKKYYIILNEGTAVLFMCNRRWSGGQSVPFFSKSVMFFSVDFANSLWQLSRTQKM